MIMESARGWEQGGCPPYLPTFLRLFCCHCLISVSVATFKIAAYAHELREGLILSILVMEDDFAEHLI